MSRGFGKLQREILRILKIQREKGKEWCDVGSLAYMMFDSVHHENCFNFNFKEYNPEKPTAAQFQSFWRAIRRIEKCQLLQSRKVPRGFMDRFGRGRGGISFSKEVRLVNV